MKTRVDVAALAQVSRQVVYVCLAVVILAMPLHAQDVHIKIMNGRNGKAITRDCVNVSLGQWHGADLLAPTNDDGVAVLHLRDSNVTAEAASPSACNGNAILGPKVLNGADTIAVVSSEYVTCEEYPITPTASANTSGSSRKAVASYSVKKILDTGITTANTCGRFRVQAKPGELILFVRSLTWGEKLRL